VHKQRLSQKFDLAICHVHRKRKVRKPIDLLSQKSLRARVRSHERSYGDVLRQQLDFQVGHVGLRGSPCMVSQQRSLGDQQPKPGQ
jgi:hypothetical protein